MLIKLNNFNLLFFGSDSFSIRVLKYILSKKLCSIEVVAKQKSLLHDFSHQNKLQVHNWPLELNEVKHTANIGLVASFGHMIGPEIVNSFNQGLFNLHPSLLPQYRGSTPIQAAIRDGIKETGCTIMRIPPITKFDVGEILLQERIEIKNREYSKELSKRLADLGATMFERFLNNYQDCIKQARSQSEIGMSYARKLKQEDGLVRFKNESSDAIDRKVRAYSGFIELYTHCFGLKLKLERVIDPKDLERLQIDELILTSYPEANDIRPGSIYFHKKRKLLCIKCSDDKWIAFDRVKPEGKQLMTSLEYYNGYISKFSLLSRVTDL